jgi:hypothetical protein
MIGTTIQKKAFFSMIPGTKSHANNLANKVNGTPAPSLMARIPGTAAHVNNLADKVQASEPVVNAAKTKIPSMVPGSKLKSIGSTITSAIKKNPKTAIGGALVAGAVGGVGAMSAKKKFDQRQQEKQQGA